MNCLQALWAYYFDTRWNNDNFMQYEINSVKLASHETVWILLISTEWALRLALNPSDGTREQVPHTTLSLSMMPLCMESLLRTFRNFNVWVNAYFIGTEFATMLVRTVVMDWNLDPFIGSKHVSHHPPYNYDFLLFVLCDWF